MRHTECDHCKTLIKNTVEECSSCSGDFHSKCGHTDKDRGRFYCPPHWDEYQKKIATSEIIMSYAESFWKELGFNISRDRRFLDAYVADLKLRIEVGESPGIHSGQELSSLSFLIDGLSSRTRLFEINLHNHDEARTKLLKSIISSLRAKKSAYSKAYTQTIAKIEETQQRYKQNISATNAIIEGICSKERKLKSKCKT